MTDRIYATGYGLNKIYKYDTTTLTKIGETINYGGTVVALYIDDDYIYCGGWITEKVYKFRKSDMTKVAESSAYGGVIEVMDGDTDHIYIGGATTQKVFKLKKTDLSKVTESGDYGGTIRAIKVDDTNVFAGGYDGETKLFKYLKTDLSKVTESADYGGIIRAIDDDDTYIYCGGDNGGTQKVYKLLKSDLSKDQESGAVATLCRSIIVNTSYVYAAGWDDGKIYKLNIADLSKDSESSAFGGAIEAMTEDTTHLYVGGLVTQKVYKYLKSDLSKVTESTAYSGAIYAISLSDTVITPILDVTKAIRLETTKEINGVWSAKMRIEANDYISAEGYVTLVNELYIVKQLKQIKRNGKIYYDIELDHNMSELSNATIERFHIVDTVSNHLDYLLTDTEWSAGTVDITATVKLVLDRRMPVLEGLYLLAEKSGGELYWNSLTRTVDLKDTIGTDTKVQIRYDKNCDFIQKDEDSTGLITRLYPYAPDNVPINTTVIQNLDDATEWTASGGSSAVDVTTNKMEGSGCVQFINSDADTLTIDLGAGDTLDLSGINTITFWVFDATGSGLDFDTDAIHFGIGEASWDDEKFTMTGSVVADSWKKIEVDISAVADGDKDAIRYVGFEGGGDNLYFDDIRAVGTAYIDSPNIANYKIKKEEVYFHSGEVQQSQKTVKIYPDDDAYVYEFYGNNNYGNLTILDVDTQTSHDYETYIKFPTSDIPAGATITSATLYMYLTYVHNGGQTADVCHTTADWSEDAITWNTKPGNGAAISTIDLTALGWRTMSLTSDFDDWYDGTKDNYGMRIYGQSDGSTYEFVWISSKEAAENKPYILVTYTLGSSQDEIVKAAAQEYLYNNDEPKLRYKVRMADLSKAIVNTWEDDTLAIGDTVRLYDADLNINTDVRVKRLTMDVLDPTKTRIDFTNRAFDITDSQVELERKLNNSMPFADNKKIINANTIQKGALGGDVN